MLSVLCMIKKFTRNLKLCHFLNILLKYVKLCHLFKLLSSDLKTPTQCKVKVTECVWFEDLNCPYGLGYYECVTSMQVKMVVFQCNEARFFYFFAWQYICLCGQMFDKWKCIIKYWESI